MIEIKTIVEYREFLEKMKDSYAADNFISNFLHAYSQISVGCSCKRKKRIKVAEAQKIKSIENLSDSFKSEAYKKFDNQTINIYHEDQLVLSIEDE
jgi:predicted transcriptional regulator